MGGNKIVGRVRKAILIGCALAFAIKGYGEFLRIGAQGGYCIHYLDGKEYKNPNIGIFLGVNLPALPFSIVGHGNLNWRTQDKYINVLSLALALRYNLCLPIMPSRFYLGVGADLDWNTGAELDWNIGEEECIRAVMGVGGMEMQFLKTRVDIFVDVRFKHLFPKEGSWNQLLISAGLIYNFL